MKKIAIIGSAGMLGHVVYTYLHNLGKYRIADASFPNKLHHNSLVLDVTDKTKLEQFIKDEKPDILINCVGALIKTSNEDPSTAIYINSFLPHFLVKLLRKHGGKLIHISTDCVFSGKKGKYTEADFCDADDIYGRSKALGEIKNDEDVTLRTSIIGPELKKNGEGLFHWVMKQKGEINGFSEVYWGGVTTLELAKVIDEVIAQDIKRLIHITNGEAISKLKLLQLIKTTFNKQDLVIEPYSKKKSDKSLKSLRNDFNFEYKEYKDMIKELGTYMKKHQDFYPSNYIIK